MIDAVINSVTGPAIVHDEADLEGAQALLVDGRGRCAVLRADGTLRTLARDLDDDIRQALATAPACPFIRLQGTRVRSHRNVAVTARA